MRADEPEQDDPYHQVFVLETKAPHLREAADTAYKRSVFDLWLRARAENGLSRLRSGDAQPGTAHEIVDEEEWQQRLNAVLAH